MSTFPIVGSVEERARFDALTDALRGSYLRFRADPDRPYTAVVIPSLSFDPRELAKIDGVAHYEERSLYNFMLLRRPRTRVVFVTSKRLNPVVVDYYLHQIRGVPSMHTRRRLTLLDCDDASPRPLTQKILERPHLLARIRAAIPDPENAHILALNGSQWERTLSVRLGIPLNACDPELTWLGSKTGSRQMFAEAGVDAAPGREGLRDVDDLVAGLASLWAERPGLRRAVVKLDESFSGEGNALVTLDPAVGPRATAAERERAVRAALPGLQLEAAGLSWAAYAEQFDQMGGVCEAWIEGEGKVSPSVQLRVNPAREVQCISTHDQVLGGPSGQVFLGATFPAAPRYRLKLQELGLRVGRVLADRGCIGRFAVDFLVLPGPDGDRFTAVEINLRSGGTTHPFNTLKFLTDGRYHQGSGTFTTTQGQERSYFTTDAVASPRYRGLLPTDLIDALVLNRMHFRQDETGVLFHLLGCLSEHGKLGCVSIAADLDAARSQYARVLEILDELAAAKG